MNGKSLYTKHNFREPSGLIPTYRCLQILTNCGNEILETYLMLMTYILIGLVVLCNFVVARFHHRLTISVIGPFLVVSGTTFISEIICFSKFEEVNALSKMFLNSLREKNIGVTQNKRMLMSKYGKSCNVLKVRMGSIGYFKRPYVIRVCEKVLRYTAKSLLMTKKLF